MDRFAQWWRRALRSGHAEAQAAARHGWLHDKAATRVLASAWLWVFFVPAALLLATWLFGPWALLGFLVYPLHAVKIALGRRSRGDSLRDATIYALFVLVTRGATWLGHWSFLRTRLQRRPTTMIEYKGHARNQT
jgi:hypothetical protein